MRAAALARSPPALKCGLRTFGRSLHFSAGRQSLAKGLGYEQRPRPLARLCLAKGRVGYFFLKEKSTLPKYIKSGFERSLLMKCNIYRSLDISICLRSSMIVTLRSPVTTGKFLSTKYASKAEPSTHFVGTLKRTRPKAIVLLLLCISGRPRPWARLHQP